MTIFWHRRDLRAFDNAGLYEALKAGGPVQPVFIFDKEILDKLEDENDARVTFIHQSVSELNEVYREEGSAIRVYYGKPKELWPQIIEEFGATAIYTNRDYEPYAQDRDLVIKKLIESKGGSWHDFKDHVIFEGHEIEKNSGGPYTVFTPYMRKWREKLSPSNSPDGGGQLVSPPRGDGRGDIPPALAPYPCEDHYKNLNQVSAPKPIPTLKDMGFTKSDIEFPPTSVARGLIRTYDETRNYPAQEGTSRLGVHFRHGTISIRQKALAALDLNDTYVNELIWRDFYSNILQNFPHVVDAPFRPEYAGIPWTDDEAHFEAWKAGKTGVPIVDAGMRELVATGYMHNRVRMITASYLTKHLLINWQWGEAWFARHLLDFELASNNGGWQWAAGCGTDAQPYFRIFNADSQQKKFDPKYEYVKRWVPEYGTSEYPEPVVEHKFGRERAIATYKEALAKAKGGG
ncbi:MAG: deoxyribodipyrimidine photo-lyase [Bacteroidota bacterium]